MQMRPATPEEIKRILKFSDCLKKLIDDPGTLYHVALNDAPGTTMSDQQRRLIDEGESHGVTVIIWDDPGRGGYFAMCRK